MQSNFVANIMVFIEGIGIYVDFQVLDCVEEEQVILGKQYIYV